MRRLPLAVCLALVGSLIAAIPAAATTIYEHDFIKSFNGAASQSVDGPVGPIGNADHIAINQSNGIVYVLDHSTGAVQKFDANGVEQSFSGLGAGVNSVVDSIIPITGDPDIAVDNSNTPSQGQLYALGEGQQVHAYAPSGVELGGNFPLNPPGDTCGGAVDPSGNFWWSWYGQGLVEYNSSGVASGTMTPTPAGSACHITIDSSQGKPTSGYFYVVEWNYKTDVYDASGNFKYTLDPDGTSAAAVDPSTGEIYVDHGDHVSEYSPSASDTPGALLGTFGGPDPIHGFNGLCSGSRGIAVNGTTHNVYVSDCGQVDIFGPGKSVIIPTATTDSADATATTAVLHGHATADGGGDTTKCVFQYGQDTNYGNTVPCADPAGPIQNADGNVAVTSAQIGGLAQGTVYHYRLVVDNANGEGVGADQTFKPQGPPAVSTVGVSDVNTDGATLRGTVDPSGDDTRYHFEWGETAAYGHSVPLPSIKLPDNHTIEDESGQLSGLQPGTTYHYQLFATNSFGSDDSGDHTFTTFPEDVSGGDNCPNAHERQQTGSALLLDCRAYELVSAGSTNGYDVQSDLVPGQAPLPAYPKADGRVAYSVHFGAIPGVGGNPTNFGLDPYLATRGSSSWTTAYAGISSNSTPDPGSFASPLGAADSSLDTLAISGANLCRPCFSDGTTGIPLRMPDGSLVQGMKGSLDPGTDAAPDGQVAKALSDDGSHLVFGSTSKFEPDGNSNGDVSIYDRNLTTGVTHVVSKTPAGATMSGPGIAELDMSSDGSRIVVAQLVSTDSKQNSHWHLYMNIGDSGQTVDLQPGGSSGVLYDGMTANGSKVFFTSPDKLVAQDTDNSSDLYEADVSQAGTVTLRLVSVGPSAGNSDACSPVASKDSAHWNGLAAADCSVLGIAGGGGVASNDGTVYFLSPEKLDGSGAQDQPNLFVARPGASPVYVATLEPDGDTVRHALTQAGTRDFGDLQVTPNGDDAVFQSTLSLTGFDNRGHSEVFRYDSGANSLLCASCAPTNAFATSDASLAQFGLSITDDGRVFFTSGDALVLRDSNGQNDVYEWEDGKIQIVSTGTSVYPSGLFSASDDGRDALFFTHDILSAQDHNGQLVKLYDARENGGFAATPPPVPCQASDECHGPGTVAAPPPTVGTYVGTGGNTQGKHQKKKHHKKRHHKRHHKKSKRNHG